MKAEVLELKRDERGYSSAIITLQEKSDQMVKDLHMKGQQFVGLEEALSRNRNDGGIKKDFHVQWKAFQNAGWIVIRVFA